MSESSSSPEPSPRDSARERILDTAYELFSQHGIRAVGVDTVSEQADVAKMTLYRNFESKEDLALEFLRMREQRWTRDWLENQVERRAMKPDERLLAIFDVFHDWFQRDDFEGCSFINVLLEFDDRESPMRQATVDHLATIRVFLEDLASEAGIERPEDFARRWHILMKGSIVAAQEGDRDAARRAQTIGRAVLAQERNGRY